MEEENIEAQKEAILSKKERNQRIVRIISLIVIVVACACLLISLEILVKHAQDIILASKIDPCSLCLNSPKVSQGSFTEQAFPSFWNSS
jgi:hypothetical protein